MKLDGEHRIVRAMNSTLQANGWSPLALCGLPVCYSRSLTVTPYFFCSDVSLKPSGVYAIEGAIGIIDQAFEALWVRNEDRQPKSPGFGVLLNILNIPQLREKRHITTDTQLESDVDDFCLVMANLLATMPHDEQQLIAAQGRDELCGFPLKAFSGYAYRTKFAAFIEFLRELAENRHGA